MYEIYADDQLIYSDVTPLESVKVIEPKLLLADSAAGQLDLSLPPTNVGYSSIRRMVTDIHVYCDGEWLWSGRVLQDNFDFWNNRKMVCEGEIAFLNDSIQPPKKYDVENTTIESFFYALIDEHNRQVGSNRRFEHGMVTVSDGDQQDDNDAINRYTNYETTLQAINDKLLNRLKGHLRVRHANGKRYLDYISDATLASNSQVVRFGVNLLDFTKNVDMSQIATVIVPRGARLEGSENVEVEGLEPYLTVKDCAATSWHDANSIFVKNPTAVSNFGWISAVVDWDQVTVKENLYTKAVRYLTDEQYEKITLEIKALDLKYLLQGDEPIKFLSKLRCISEPHNMDHTFLVSKMEVDLSNPGNSLYTLGSDVQLSLTAATNKVNSSILEEIEKIPSEDAILKAAKENAFQILTGANGGYVRFGKYPGTDIIREIIISNQSTDETSTRKWVFNEGGLGHFTRPNVQTAWASSYGGSSDGIYGGLNVAITMDGKINCGALYGGIIYGQKIQGGTIKGTLILGTTIEGGTIKSGLLDGNGRVITDDNSTSYGWISISGGKLEVHNGTSGFAKFTQAYRNSSDKAYKDEYCTIGGSRWYFHYYDDGWHDQSFNTRGLIHAFQALIRNEWLDEDELY